MIRNQSGQAIGAEMINATTGAAFVAAVTVYVTLDAGTQAIGTVGAGVCTHEGNGYHTYRPTAAETNGALVAFTFIGAGALPYTLQVEPVTAAQATALSSASAGGGGITARQYCIDALMEIGYLGADDELDGADGALALRILQRMTDAAQADPLQLFARTRTVAFSLAGGQQTRTIGSGGDFNTTRPVWVEHVGVFPVGDTVEYEIVPYTTRAEWDGEPNKSLTDSWPQRYLYELGAVLGTFTFWPIPTTAAVLALTLPTPLDAVGSLDTTLVFPPGYREAWTLVLARKCCRPFRIALSPDLAADAADALSMIRRMNDPGPGLAAADPALLSGGAYDIRTGQHR